jgi:hypothetical protein
MTTLLAWMFLSPRNTGAIEVAFRDVYHRRCYQCLFAGAMKPFASALWLPEATFAIAMFRTSVSHM